MAKTVLVVDRKDTCCCTITDPHGEPWLQLAYGGGSCPHGSTVKPVEYALPEGTVSIETQDEKFGRVISKCNNGRWSWYTEINGSGYELVGDGYADTFDEAWNAADDAEERWEQEHGNG